jgi:4-amino-4-deoxy-L-arabinose transferase-like glycosyltransferase
VRALPVRSSTSAETVAVEAADRVPATSSIWRPAALGAGLFVLAFVLRLWGHTQSVTADDQDWIRRAVDFSQAVEHRVLRATYQSAHPGVPVLWIAQMVIPPGYVAELEARDDDRTRLEKSSSYLPSLYRVRQALAGYAAALTVALALLTGRLFGWHVGVLAGLLLAAEPFLVAHAQVFSTDSLLAMLMAASILAALVYFDGRGGRFYLAMSGLAAGLAFSTKAPAILLFGLIPLVAVLLAAAGRRDDGSMQIEDRQRWRIPRARLWLLIRDLLLWGAVAALVYIIIWPALWVAPVETLTRLERGVRGIGESPRRWGNFFLGRIYDDDDVPMSLWPVFYPLVTSLRLSPVTFVGLLMLIGAAIVGSVRTSIRTWTADRRVLALAGCVLAFTLMMTISPKKLDRYLLPVYPALVILAAVGIWLMVRRWLPGRLHWPAIVALGVCQAALVASVAPYPLSFYNPLLGGAPTARQTTIVGWGEGLDQVAAYLDQQPDARQIVAVSLYKDQIVPLFRGNGARLEDWQRGNVLVTYVNMEQRGLVPAPLQELVASTPPQHTVWINGIVYARVYRIPPEIRERAGREAGPRPNAVPNP